MHAEEGSRLHVLGLLRELSPEQTTLLCESEPGTCGAEYSPWAEHVGGARVGGACAVGGAGACGRC